MAAQLSMFVAGVAALAAFAAGCGSGGGSPSVASSSQKPQGGAVTTGTQAPGSSLSRAQFVKRANAACAKERTRSLEEDTAFARRYESEDRPESGLLAHLVGEVLLPRIDRETAKIAALGAAAGGEADVGSFLAAQREAVKKVEELANPKSLAQVEAQFDQAGKLAWAYGISNCDNGRAPPRGSGG